MPWAILIRERVRAWPAPARASGVQVRQAMGRADKETRIRALGSRNTDLM
jgi:hypothetical protein